MPEPDKYTEAWRNKVLREIGDGYKGMKHLQNIAATQLLDVSERLETLETKHADWEREREELRAKIGEVTEALDKAREEFGKLRKEIRDNGKKDK